MPRSTVIDYLNGQKEKGLAIKVIVTGGGGFVGKALCRRLCTLGYEVVSIARHDYPELRGMGVHTNQFDLSQNGELFAHLFKDVHAVFHTASKVDFWGRYDDFFRSNVIATRNVMEACRKHNVSKLIYTSSPSVIADGNDHLGVNETFPYPSKHAAFYPATKAITEREVLAANSPDFSTISLRPHLIWGPGDRHLVPRILKRASAGRLIRIGNGHNVVDFCYIDDCVQSHILALHALEDHRAGGQAYFITQGEPTKFWSWIDEVLLRNNLSPVTRSLPLKVAKTAAAVFERAARCLPGQPEPLLTRFLVSQMSCSHYFDISKAKRDLGYSPLYSITEAMDLTFGSQS